jgi:hypothetical protein
MQFVDAELLLNGISLRLLCSAYTRLSGPSPTITCAGALGANAFHKNGGGLVRSPMFLRQCGLGGHELTTESLAQQRLS